MILNQNYSTKQLATVLSISYDHFRKYRKEYEEHLSKFYIYEIIKKGNTTYYNFINELYEYVSYKEYKAMQKSKILQKHIKQTIEQDKRQTGANIARIIIVDGEIQALDWKLSTLTVYVRDELHDMIQDGYYTLMDYQWCYLNRDLNQYILMPEEDVKILRTYFQTKELLEAEENILSAAEQGSISKEACNSSIVELRKDNFVQGRKKFQNDRGYWPMKVPVYERNACKIEKNNVKSFDF